MLVVDVDVVVVEPAGVEPVAMSVLSFLKRVVSLDEGNARSLTLPELISAE